MSTSLLLVACKAYFYQTAFEDKSIDNTTRPVFQNRNTDFEDIPVGFTHLCKCAKNCFGRISFGRFSKNDQCADCVYSLPRKLVNSMGVYIFRYFWLFLFYGVFCISCKPISENGTNTDEVLAVESDNPVQAGDIKTSEVANTREEVVEHTIEHFAQLVDTLPVESLPYLIGEEMFLMADYRANERVRKMIRYSGVSLGKAFGIEHFRDSVVLDVVARSRFISDFGLYKRLSPRNDSIELLVFNSEYTLIIASFNKNTLSFVDQKVLSEHEEGEFYWSSGACINPNFSIYNIVYASYESSPFVRKQKMHIEENGQITVEASGSYSSADIDVLDDYTKPYYLNQEPKKWTMAPKNRKRLFTYDFLAQIPEVLLPHTSGTFNSLFRVWDPVKDEEAKSTLFESRLKSSQSSDPFFSNDRTNVAFRYDADEEKWTGGKFFYPVFRFKCDTHIAVGFLYRSFLRSQPAFYFQINTYTPGGEIVDRVVICRSFFHDSRVVNDFVINEDLTIDVMETIQDFDMFGYDEGMEYPLEEKIRHWHFSISKDGSISKAGPIE